MGACPKAEMDSDEQFRPRRLSFKTLWDRWLSIDHKGVAHQASKMKESMQAAQHANPNPLIIPYHCLSQTNSVSNRKGDAALCIYILTRCAVLCRQAGTRMLRFHWLACPHTKDLAVFNAPTLRYESQWLRIYLLCYP